MSLALKEVEAYTLFSPHPNIIHSIDYSVETDKSDSSAKTVYILLPYYRRGNLQDMINANLVNHTKFPERRLMVLFLGISTRLKVDLAAREVRARPRKSGEMQREQMRKLQRAWKCAQAGETAIMRKTTNKRQKDC